jgi:hypothetical protein
MLTEQPQEPRGLPGAVPAKDVVERVQPLANLGAIEVRVPGAGFPSIRLRTPVADFPPIARRVSAAG